MVTGERKCERMNKKEILSLISEYDVFRHLLGRDFKVGVSFCNPLRGEDVDSAIIREYNGRLWMKDYGNSSYSGDCFDLWQLVYGCSFTDALEGIETLFRLGTSGQKNVITWKQPKMMEVKPLILEVETRPPNDEELKYWADYELDFFDLQKEDIYFPREVWRNKRLLRDSPYVTFCYWYEELKKFKIYRPHGEMGKRVEFNRRKWDSSVPNDYVENFQAMTGGNIAIVTKSKKDRMCISKALGTNQVCNIQSENIATLNDEKMETLRSTYDKLVIASDNDVAGKKFSYLLTEGFGFKHVNVPDGLTSPEGKPIKDFADYGRYMGHGAIYTHFLNKQLI